MNACAGNKSYDILRQEGLLTLSRKSGAVVRRDASTGPPDPAWENDWTGRLRILLAEAAAQGLPPAAIIEHSQAALGQFALPEEKIGNGPEEES